MAARRAASALILCVLVLPEAARADDPAARPAFSSNRWQEDWSVLADPAVPKEPLDSLKYIPFTDDGQTYVSLGATLRERVESQDAPQFGTAGHPANTYLLDRLQVHADLRIQNWQVFVQLADDEAPGKYRPGPADADRLDVEQAFVAHVGTVGDGVLKLRAGRQEFGFDLQRFVSTRDGPNVRQAFDALWADYEIGKWRFITFASHPTQYRNTETFDDYSGHNLALHGFRVERQGFGPGDLAVYYLRYEHEGARFATAAGNEQRNILDLHYTGNREGVDWDVEAMGQQGSIGVRDILAWAIGARAGYTFADVPWSPHVMLQFDAASGSSSATGTVGTFNPLFPNGSYFTLAGFTGDANLIHVKPMIAVAPTPKLKLLAGIGLQWRETTQDAIYTFPAVPVPNTAGRGDAWSGAYVQLRADYAVNAHVATAVELVHYQVGSTIRRAGGRNADYAGVELKLQW